MMKRGAWGSKIEGTTAIMVLLLVAVQLVGTAGPALAAKATCGLFDNWLYGATKTSNIGNAYLAGAQADIMTRRNDLCGAAPADGHKIFSNAWSMLQNPTGQRYAQIGFERHPGGGGCSLAGNGCLEFFAAYNKTGSSQVLTHFGNPSNGTSNVYKVTWKDGAGEDGFIHLIRCDSTNNNPPGGTNCVDRTPAGLNWNPSSAGWGSSLATWFGETNDKSTDMPGTSSNHASFLYILIREQQTAWGIPGFVTKCTQNTSAPSPTCSDSYSAYHFGNQTSQSFHIWTDPISR